MTDPTSSLPHQKSPDASYQTPGPTDKYIPFIKPVQILKFDSTGAVFVGFDEIKIDIPPNAIPDGSTGYLEVGVCLYGPFTFEKDYRPISPILWLCLQGENTHLDEPVIVTLPHILPDLSEKELASSGVRFATANHDCIPDASGERMYKFRPYRNIKTFYYSSMGKGYGVLQTRHFCYICLESKDPQTLAAMEAKAKRSGYCLAFVKGPFVLLICALFNMKTCLAVSIIDRKCY